MFAALTFVSLCDLDLCQISRDHGRRDALLMRATVYGRLDVVLDVGLDVRLDVGLDVRLDVGLMSVVSPASQRRLSAI